VKLDRHVQGWPPEARYRYEERAGIRALDPTQTLEQAEHAAEREVREWWRRLPEAARVALSAGQR